LLWFLQRRISDDEVQRLRHWSHSSFWKSLKRRVLFQHATQCDTKTERHNSVASSGHVDTKYLRFCWCGKENAHHKRRYHYVMTAFLRVLGSQVFIQVRVHRVMCTVARPSSRNSYFLGSWARIYSFPEPKKYWR
jgi:hypothetical protein